MMHFALAQSDTRKRQQTEDFVGQTMLDLHRWTGLAREAIPASKAGYVFALPAVFARQTLTTGAQMRREKVMSFASVVSFEDEALHEAVKLLGVRFRREARAQPVSKTQFREVRAAETEAVHWLANLTSRGCEVSDVAATIESLFTDLDAHGIKAVDEMLTRIDVPNANHVLLVAVLRALFRSRAKMSNWSHLRELTYALLSQRGRNPDRVMAGLNAG